MYFVYHLNMVNIFCKILKSLQVERLLSEHKILVCYIWSKVSDSCTLHIHVVSMWWTTVTSYLSRHEILLCDLLANCVTLTLHQDQWYMHSAYRPNVVNICAKLYANLSRHWSVTEQTGICNGRIGRLTTMAKNNVSQYVCRET